MLIILLVPMVYLQIVAKYQTLREIHMNKTVLSIVLLLGLAVVVGSSAVSYAAQSAEGVMDDTRHYYYGEG